MSVSRRLILSTVPNLPEIRPGDNLAELIYKSIIGNNMTIEDGDIFVIAQKSFQNPKADW